jgi:AraC family transcriptional regulator, positive regulator of tynA and feaB
MQPLFSTAGLHPRNSFQRWQEFLLERQVPLEQTRLDPGSFEGRLDVAEIGPLLMTRITQGSMRSAVTPAMIRRFDKGDTLVVVFKLAGVLATQQDERSCLQRQGDLFVLDHRPAVLTSGAGSQSMFLELPRTRLESVLGPSRLFTALTVGASLASAALTTTFFHELIRIRHHLAPDAVARMAGIGVDLIVASIAERMSLEVARPVHGSVVVQRAKAHVEAHLGDLTLDPPQLAAAVGVSLRRLQELFHERGEHISDYIRDCRIGTAAQRLADPACADLPIGLLAYGCGFTSQAHFARRFKERHGMTPRAYRHAALQPGSAGGMDRPGAARIRARSPTR